VPVSTDYTPDPRHPRLGPAFYDAVAPAAFPKHAIRFRNDRWARRVGLDGLSDAEWADHFAAFAPLPDNIEAPLALRYHGHQFRHYNPELGDGRGFLFAQLRDGADGRLLDLATKGSGQTPWSRQGDGRLTLKGGVREVLATELLEALGCYTSKSFSLIETGEALHRHDEPSPTRSAVLVRLGHSHVRIGTFQRIAFQGDSANLQRLCDYAIDTYWPAARADDDPVAGLFARVCGAVAEMAAEWYAAGFVHGVLNTDNTVITGESFDYGPWRFLPTLDVMFTAAYFDQTGLYAFGRQPGALHWNLQRLADCLLPLTTEARLIEGLDGFSSAFEARLSQMTLARLGLNAPDGTETDQLNETLIRPFYQALHASGVPFERAFFDLMGGADANRLAASPQRAAYEGEAWSQVIAALRQLERRAESPAMSDYADRPQPATLLYDEVEALWAPIAADDDWSRFEAKIAEIRAAGAAYATWVPHRAGAVSIHGDAADGGH